MNGFLPNPSDWMRIMLDAQKAQIEAAEQLFGAGQTGLDPARFEEARQNLEEAGQKALAATENLVRAQWEWLNLWRC